MKNNYNVNMTGLGSLELGAPLASKQIKIKNEFVELELPTTPSSGMFFAAPMTTQMRDDLTAQYNIRDGALFYNIEEGQFQGRQNKQWVSLVSIQFDAENANKILKFDSKGSKIVASDIREEQQET